MKDYTVKLTDVDETVKVPAASFVQDGSGTTFFDETGAAVAYFSSGLVQYVL